VLDTGLADECRRRALAHVVKPLADALLDRRRSSVECYA
jgi:hypothetical protein